MAENVNYKKLQMNLFEDWREDISTLAKYICFGVDGDLIRRSWNLEELININTVKLRTFPKTITRLTRQICECDEVCTQNSLKNFYLLGCMSYDEINLYSDDDFYSNYLVNNKVVNGTLLDINTSIDSKMLRDDLKKIMLDLCEDEKDSLRKLKCKAYELKDQCGENLDCLTEVTYGIVPPNFRKCRNINFSTDLDNIGYKIGDPMILKHVRVGRDVSYISASKSSINNGALILFVPLLILSLLFTLSNSRKTCIIKIIGFLIFAVILYAYVLLEY